MAWVVALRPILKVSRECNWFFVNYLVSIPGFMRSRWFCRLFSYDMSSSRLLIGLRQLNQATIQLRKYNRELLELLVQTVESETRIRQGIRSGSLDTLELWRGLMVFRQSRLSELRSLLAYRNMERFTRFRADSQKP